MTKEQILQKVTSRKFLMALAAFLASLGASITGIASGNETLAVIGTICTTVSAALYAAMEAYVDATRIKNNPE